jgi:deoxyribodipyrimidine photo-lyase
MNTLLWFRNNLRLIDNEPLTEACSRSSQLQPVLFIPEDFSLWGASRKRFWIQSVQNFQQDLEKHGSKLLLLNGNPVRQLQEILETGQFTHLIFENAVAWNEVQQETEITKWCKPKGITCLGFESGGLFRQMELPFSLEQLPAVFTQFRHKVEAGCRVAPPLPAPASIPGFSGTPPLESVLLPEAESKPHPRSVLPFEGGETAAWERLNHYFGADKHLSRYKETRNGLLGSDYSSKFSPWLALGCISARSVVAEIKAYEKRNGANDSTYWLFFELLWREYFRWIALQQGRKIFLPGGIQGKPPSHYRNPKRFEAWCQGITGEPFVDANMQELLHTGFMSNRGRQNVASFLVHDLGLDWRLGAGWFERNLIDYDPASNWGNWNYVAGIGNDPREGRRFNIRRQAEMYDPKGEYVDFWIGSTI